MPAFGIPMAAGGRGRDRFERMAALARRAEAAGLDAVWTNDLYNRSANVMMTTLALGTERIAIGSAIAYGVGRTPLTWAAEARDLDELSGGRLILGLGNGTARMMEDWHGVSGEAPALRMEELVEVLRKLWRLDEGPVDHEGRFYRVRVRPTADVSPPLRERLPIYTAGINPRMVETAGRVADGLCGHPMFTRLYIDEVVRPAIERGARKRGRDPREIALVRDVMCNVHEDVEQARRELAFAIAQYAASGVYQALFDLHGWDRRPIVDAVRSRDPAAVAAAVGDEIIDAIGITCRPGELAEALDRDWGSADHVMLAPPPWGLTAERVAALLDALIEARVAVART